MPMTMPETNGFTRQNPMMSFAAGAADREHRQRPKMNGSG
jgi:hypothetical protein